MYYMVCLLSLDSCAIPASELILSSYKEYIIYVTILPIGQSVRNKIVNALVHLF